MCDGEAGSVVREDYLNLAAFETVKLDSYLSARRLEKRA